MPHKKDDGAYLWDMLEADSIRNPYRRREIMNTRRLIHAV